MTFSSTAREEVKHTLSSNHFDLIVIGGGITGAGIALDASKRGMKVALVEMQDFAAGTSSRSTKLVHGGLRYLKQFEVKMVAEVGKEREIVYENGPHVTTPEWMLLPLHKGGTFGKFSTSIGLKVYDYLAGVKRSERRSMLSVSETLTKEPLVKKDGLKGGGYYVEYRTDDARLTIEVMKEAVAHGATVLNYMKSQRFLYDNKKVVGIEAEDLVSGETIDIRGSKIVNAAGPWVDDVRGKDYSTNNKQLRLTKGVHLVIDQSKFPLQQAVYFDTPDGRMVFAIPRDGKAYVGTTDTFFDSEKASPHMTSEDRDYILNAIHFMFPDVSVGKEDVESSWAGVRPLIFEKGKDPSEISRKDEVWEAESGLITIAGGKLTGYRKMGEHVVDLVSKRLKEERKQKFPASATKHMPISGGHVGGSKNFQSFIDQKAGEALQYGLSEAEGRKLAGMYGSNVDQLFKLAHAYSGSTDERSVPPYLYAQLIYAIQEEMAATPVDFFIRRTGALFFDREWVEKWKEPVIEMMSKLLNWTSEQKDKYTADLNEELKNAVVPVDLQS
ncbi:glycerol-3-phosphate dehydrogenase/oxidase [Rossellomorea vietnamensis]|uniref:Glycerol-3-phosphate dehydrogenase n=1 Tax=Rossellomorea vietnamensis TaxID=218284 RepID=A0A6I6USN7_9BACI|nr:glycerol-3-phosphate dehydrogenase/oxidase [Rossellomorea vietnamensis]OXS60102.1 glycerol-3-phosphate dehydrogenase [Bacillus sp. DSM 27956]PRX76302.1 homodimeric glycerol 3-phosphate dehydrogenase (quinone) [Bacillus sp. V-88]MCC5802483.1 glycerol-3-phosphate dehydrogenase/oxidase [Rossellomorea vietnamensis]QHE61626.1 FAD-dependent oxidoreductase [Rossellomorea vietnamensis]SLK22726.1 homodimeric glycerol 3-phosphate dehydrogenase (quinone) [Bacillus sp. V-88]